MAKTTNTRKTVELARKKLPIKKMFHGKEIRAAMEELELFRRQFNEHEILYGAKVHLVVGEYGEVTALVRRLETDKEFGDRIERARIANEQKIERERKRVEAAAEKARREEERRKIDAVEYIKRMAKQHGLSRKEVLDILEET